MKKISFSRWLTPTFAFLLLLPILVLPIHASSSLIEIPDPYGAPIVYLYNYESAKVLMRRENTEHIAPASTVKMMTGLLAIAKLQGRLDTKITVTEEMLADVEGYTVNFEPGMVLSALDILYALICGGGNDAAHILAIYCSGSIEAFVSEMNASARAWGCTDTTYKNPTGLDVDGMTTTLNDTIIIAEKAIENDLFLEISSAPNHTYKPLGATDSTVFYNRNALISTFSGMGYKNQYAHGLNAGMTQRGGYCVVTYATDENASYLCIVMGASETPDGIMSYRIANQLINHVIQRYSYTQIAKKGDVICSIPVELALPKSGETETTLPCILTEDIYAYIPAGLNRDAFEFNYYFHEDILTAPVKKGQIVGGVDVYCQGEKLASGKICTVADATPSSLLQFLDIMRNAILSRVSVLFVLYSATLLILFLIFSKKTQRKKQ